MDNKTLNGPGGHAANASATARKRYVTPTVETLGGALATLLASGCKTPTCTVCDPLGDPLLNNNT